MMAEKISKRVVVDRLAWIEQMTGEIRALPLNDREAFFADQRNVWAAESCLIHLSIDLCNCSFA